MSFQIKDFLPIFDMSAPVSAALHNEDGKHAGAVIVTDGTDFYLQQHADLAQAVAQQGGTLQLGALHRQAVKILAKADIAASGIDMVQFETRSFPSSGRVPGFAAGSGNVAILFEDTQGTFRVVAKQRWQCVPHGERYIRNQGGQCPNHTEGVLKKI